MSHDDEIRLEAYIRHALAETEERMRDRFEEKLPDHCDPDLEADLRADFEDHELPDELIAVEANIRHGGF